MPNKNPSKRMRKIILLVMAFVPLSILVANEDLWDKDVEIETVFETAPEFSGVATGLDAVAPDEIIVKFTEAAANALEEQLNVHKSVSYSEVSHGLGQLNARYRVKQIKPLFKNFKKNSKKWNALLQKDASLLTEKEERLLRRRKRAPKGAKVPALDRIYRIHFELKAGQSLEEVKEAYESDPGVEYAELNHIVTTCVTPSDPLYPIQWPLNNTGQAFPPASTHGNVDCDIDAPEAWDITTGSPDVIVAVADTGVDYRHRDLNDNMWINSGEIPNNGIDDELNGYIDDVYGYDFCTYDSERDSDPLDDNGHGTHVAGIIAAEGDNGLDIVGVSWNAKIMAVKFIASSGYGYEADAVDAIYYAIENGADVISNSWGSDDDFAPLEEVIDYARSRGVVMLASAGNTRNSAPHYPAYYDNMVSVAATTATDERAGFSTYGDWVDTAAPGHTVLSLRATGTSLGTPYNLHTTIASGTSMACPYAAGVVALIISRHPEWSSEMVIARLLGTADPVASTELKGRVNAYKAVREGFAFAGSISLDANLYLPDDIVSIKVIDFDLMGQQTQEVTVRTDGGDEETVTLVQDVDAPAIFRGTIHTFPGSVASEDGVLQVSHGQILTATYHDADDGSGGAAEVETTAGIDGQPPVIIRVQVVDILSRRAKVTVRTDEPTSVSIRCGLAPGGPYTMTGVNRTLATDHTFALTELTSETSYYFEIDAIDSIGHETTDNNGGQCSLLPPR